MDRPTFPCFSLPRRQLPACWRLSPGNDVDQVTEQVIALCRRYVPETLPLEIHRLTDVRQTQAATIGMMKSSMGVLALICVLLVVLGVYSSVTMDAEARRKEVAIRKINGASPPGYRYIICTRLCRNLSGCFRCDLSGAEACYDSDIE